MTEAEIITQLKTKFPEVKLEWVEAAQGDNYLFVPIEAVHEVIQFLKQSDELYFDYLVNLSAFDAAEHIEVTYHIYSYKHRHKLVVKVKAPRLNGEVTTVTDLYGTALFQEREVFDLLGVKFKGHPGLTRILLPDDWVGHPLLKDYVEGEEYQGISTRRESLV